VWLEAARAPALERPALTVTIAFSRLTRRAIGTKWRGLPKDSRYRSKQRMVGSRPQYSIRSLALTSARLPIDTNIETPSES
jgi:hypothetical protein